MSGVKTLEGFHSLIWCIFCPTLVAITLGEEVGYDHSNLIGICSKTEELAAEILNLTWLSLDTGTSM
jgi:hypothetical protein